MKGIVQLVSFIGLLLVFTAAGANAQSAYGTEVKIPFSFNVGTRSYEAGEYIVKVNKQATGATILSIRDTAGDDVQQVLLRGSGDVQVEGLKLTFANVGGRKFLEQVQTPTSGYKVAVPEADAGAQRAVARIPSKKPNSTKVN